MNVLISGVNGLIGSALVEQFDGKHRIDLLTTAPEQARRRFGEHRHCWTWDDLSRDGAALLGRYDVILNMAGAPIMQRWTDAARHEIRESRAGRTGLIAGCIRDAGLSGIRVINASSTYIYGYHPDVREQNAHVLDERSEVDAYACGNFIVGICKAWEQALDVLDGSRVVKLRIGVVLSGRGGVLPPMIRYARMGLGGRVGSGLQPCPWISLADAVRAIDFIIDHPELHGPINLVAPENLTQQQVGRAVGDLLNKRILLPMPAWLIRVLYGDMGIQSTLNGPQVHPGVLLDAGFRFEDPELTHALRRIREHGL